MYFRGDTRTSTERDTPVVRVTPTPTPARTRKTQETERSPVIRAQTKMEQEQFDILSTKLDTILKLLPSEKKVEKKVREISHLLCGAQSSVDLFQFRAISLFSSAKASTDDSKRKKRALGSDPPPPPAKRPRLSVGGDAESLALAGLLASIPRKERPKFWEKPTIPKPRPANGMNRCNRKNCAICPN